MATGDRLSIVVPSRGEGAGLARCLAALVRMEAADEIVVAAHGEPVRLARRARRCARLVWVDCPQPGRGLQMNAGACSAHGELLLFLHADTRLPRGAAGMVRAALADPRVAGGAFRLGFDARHPVLDLLARCSAVDWRQLPRGSGTVLPPRAVRPHRWILGAPAVRGRGPRAPSGP